VIHQTNPSSIVHQTRHGVHAATIDNVETSYSLLTTLFPIECVIQPQTAIWLVGSKNRVQNSKLANTEADYGYSRHGSCPSTGRVAWVWLGQLKVT